MSSNLSNTQAWDDEDSRIKPVSDEPSASGSHRSPVRIYAVVMNMRRVAHSRRISSVLIKAR